MVATKELSEELSELIKQKFRLKGRESFEFDDDDGDTDLIFEVPLNHHVSLEEIRQTVLERTGIKCHVTQIVNIIGVHLS